MSILSKLSYRLSALSINQQDFFVNTDQLIVKFIKQRKKNRQKFFLKKNKFGEITVCDFKIVRFSMKGQIYTSMEQKTETKNKFIYI